MTDAIDRSHEDAVGDGVRALDQLPGLMLVGAVLDLDLTGIITAAGRQITENESHRLEAFVRRTEPFTLLSPSEVQRAEYVVAERLRTTRAR